MHYELVNNINQGSAEWQLVQENVKAQNSQVIALTAAPRFAGLLAEEQVQGFNVLDRATGRTYVPDQYRFFNEVPIPTWSKVEMNSDGSIVILNQGDQIAREFLFPNTRRAVQDIRYTNLDGSLDFIEEFAFDGSKFSNLFYSDGDLQEIDFFNSNDQVVVRYYFYEGYINYVTIEDPATHQVVKDYATLDDFLIDQLQQNITADDTVTIHQLGIELTALRDTSSYNILAMHEPVQDAQGQIRQNLQMILEDQITSINEVQVTPAEHAQIKQKGLPTKKLRVIRR